MNQTHNGKLIYLFIFIMIIIVNIPIVLSKENIEILRKLKYILSVVDINLSDSYVFPILSYSFYDIIPYTIYEIDFKISEDGMTTLESDQLVMIKKITLVYKITYGLKIKGIEKEIIISELINMTCDDIPIIHKKDIGIIEISTFDTKCNIELDNGSDISELAFFDKKDISDLAMIIRNIIVKELNVKIEKISRQSKPLLIAFDTLFTQAQRYYETNNVIIQTFFTIDWITKFIIKRYTINHDTISYIGNSIVNIKEMTIDCLYKYNSEERISRSCQGNLYDIQYYHDEKSFSIGHSTWVFSNEKEYFADVLGTLIIFDMIKLLEEISR